MCSVTKDHKQRKESCHNIQHVSPSILCVLAMDALLPLAAEAAVKTAVTEAATAGEAMVVEITAETEAGVGAYNNQP
jgi:hypothetical protein